MNLTAANKFLDDQRRIGFNRKYLLWLYCVVEDSFSGFSLDQSLGLEMIREIIEVIEMMINFESILSSYYIKTGRDNN